MLTCDTNDAVAWCQLMLSCELVTELAQVLSVVRLCYQLGAEI